MKFVFGWIVPGGAYLLKRRYDQFALSFALVLMAFAGGVALDGLSNSSQPGVFGAVATVSQWLAGGPYLIAKIFSHPTLPIDAPIHNYGLALLMAGGTLNLLAMADRD